MDGVLAPAPLPLSKWPRRRIFPDDPRTRGGDSGGGGAETIGRAYYLIEDGRSVPRGGTGDDSSDAAAWQMWLWLPPMDAGERAVRVRPGWLEEGSDYSRPHTANS